MDGVISQELEDAIKCILQACRKAGKKCGIYSTGGEQAKKFALQGFDMINVAADYTALQHTLKENLSQALGKAAPSKAGSY